MSTATKKNETIELSTKELAALTPEVSDKKTFTAEELMLAVAERFNMVLTKSAMLKTLRAAGYAVAQNRCYNAYLQIEKALEDKAKAKAKAK